MTAAGVAARFAAVTASQMAEVDRRAMERFELSLPQMMENAGRALARLARERFFDGHAGAGRVTVMAGPGGNGGGALAAARRLAGWGARVVVFATAEPAAMAPITAQQARTVRAFGIDVAGPADAGVAWPPAATPDLVLDGLLGYGAAGEARGRVRDAIDWVRASGAPVLSLDVPSGMDATTGYALGPAVRADATLTLAAPKSGLLVPEACGSVGELYLADIGIPAAAFDGLLDVRTAASWFVEDDLVRMW